ncbi:MAG TPA: tetratricopeptide repeat protein, partial [Planctomycetaceae bacterium]|nr:tetratricopeptide repeat protein [Planctomycetaceae bacterium]
SAAGPGGLGKTQIAVEFAIRDAPNYDAVCWVGADSPMMLNENYAALATEFGLAIQDRTSRQEAIEAVRAWFDTHNRWLLIFDGALGPDDVAEFLPQEPAGHVIITSRHPDWHELAQTLEVSVLSRAESAQLLLTRTRQEAPIASADLAAELGDLPLALAQAAGYIALAKIPVANYLDFFRKRRDELWKLTPERQHFNDTVATTWAVATGRLPEQVVELLRLCAFLAPEGIPLWLFSEHAGDLPVQLRSAAANALQRKACLNDLVGHSLASATQELLWIHPLVQAVIAGRLSLQETRRSVHGALRLVNAAFNAHSDDPRTVEAITHLLPHALAVLRNASRHDISPGLCGRLANRVGQYLQHHGHLAEARRLLQEAVDAKHKAYTADHPTLATSYSNLAVVEQALGNLAEAERLLRQALDIDKKAYALDHPTLATGYSNLGLVEKALGNLPEARRLLLYALEISQKAYAGDHPALAGCYFNLAEADFDLGNQPEACAHMRKACTIRLARFGENHPATKSAVDWLVQHDPDFRDAMWKKVE